MRTELSNKNHLFVETFAGIIIFCIWFLFTHFNIIPMGILPSPIDVITSFKDLYVNDNLITHILYSFKLNTYGLLEAIVLSIPLGYAIGLNPYIKAALERYTVLVRFLPLTAITGIFIAWFGIGDMMKIQFLAFSIFIYLVPAIIERIKEVPEVYVQTLRTLGASKYDLIKHVFIPGAMSAVLDDIRILAALSWTYVVVVELINTNAGGVGALSYLAARQSRIDKVFAVLIVIMLIGFIQDKIIKFIGNRIFPFKSGGKK